MHNPLHPYYLQQMGIETWLLRKPIAHNIKLMIVAEALDTNKQATGLLNKMLNSIGLSLNDVSIKSILTHQLIQDITNNPPQLVLAIGSAAIKFLLNNSQPINTLRGKIHTCYNTSLIVSYHPAELLQHPSDKKNAWQDLVCIQEHLA